MIVELKWNQQVDGAIAQIKDKRYVKALDGYGKELMLAGVNYNKKTKKHECMIERI